MLPSAAVSVSQRGKRRFSDVDVERARLLHQYALHGASADAQLLADLAYSGIKSRCQSRSSTSKALASFKSSVSKPSVNQL